MKKLLSIITVLVVATMAFTSCGGGGSKDKKGLKTLYTITVSHDVLAASDIEITYKGKGGIDITDTIRSDSWMKIITNDSFPVEIGFKYRFLIKPEAKFKKDIYKLFNKDRCKLYCSFDCLVWGKPYLSTLTPVDIDDIASDKVAAYLEICNNNSKNVSLGTINYKDGNFNAEGDGDYIKELR